MKWGLTNVARPWIAAAGRGGLVRAAGVVMGLTVLARVSGFLREAALAAGFGATAASDSYLLAFTIPNLMAAVLGGAVSRALVPPFTALQAGGRSAAAWRLGSAVLNAVSVATLVLAAVGMANTEGLVRLLAPGFRGEALTQAVAAVRILLPAMFFYCGGLVVAALLQSLRRFTLPAAVPVVQNLVIATGAIMVSGGGPVTLAGITLAAVSLELLVPVFGLRRYWSEYRPTLSAPDLRRTANLALPLIAAATVNQLVSAVDWAVASGTGSGSIAALSFADRLRQVPLGLFAAPAATVLFPELSELAARGDRARFRRQWLRGLGLVLLVTVPAALALAAFREPLVALAFQRGRFDANDAARTAAALLWMAPGLVGMAAGSVLSLAFYAREQSRIPFLVQAAGAALNIGLDFTLAGRYGHIGVAMAGSIAVCVVAAAYGLILAWRERR